ncbi:amidase [Desulfatiferula olefinivorans]
MKKHGGFILLSPDEVRDYLLALPVNRVVGVIQNHHTFLPDYGTFNARPDHMRLLAAMKNHHVVNNGWSDIAQNLTTFPDGTVAVCRPLSVIPAGISGHNARAVCIEHLGNFDEGKDTMTEAHRRAIIHLNAVLLEKFGLTPSTESIVYHHFFHSKTCPGTAFFGGNTREAAEAHFIPLIAEALKAIARPAPPPETPLFYRLVLAAYLNIRTAPGVNNPKDGLVHAGATVPVYEERSGWSRISPSASRWVASRYLTPIDTARVGTRALNVRSGPGTAFAILTTLVEHTPVTVYERRRSWCRIDPNEKWVACSYLDFD